MKAQLGGIVLTVPASYWQVFQYSIQASGVQALHPHALQALMRKRLYVEMFWRQLVIVPSITSCACKESQAHG